MLSKIMENKQKVLDLNKQKEVLKEMYNYLDLECLDYLGSKPVFVKLASDFRIRLFEGEERSRVLVYDVKLENGSEAFGTIGSIAYPHLPPYSNVFPKPEIKDADIAARMHFYLEAINRYGNTSVFSKKESLEQLAEMLEIPMELRRKNKNGSRKSIRT